MVIRNAKAECFSFTPYAHNNKYTHLPQNKEFLTEPYISRSKNGSGIGLAVVKKILQDHNGNIELENNKNDKGAKVSLLFPMN